MRHKLIYLLFLIVPLFVLATSIETIQRRGNNWFGGDYDPAYCYLLNSVNNASLKATGHVDHPGTTAQVFGAVVLRVYHLLNRSEQAELHTAVLKDPERHLFVMTYAFLGFNCLFLFFSGIVAFKGTGKPWLAVLLQTAPFFSAMALYNGLTHISQESMLFLSAMMMLTLVSWQFFPGLKKSSRRNILLFAIVTGFGMASKVTFLPLVILPLILIPGLRNKLWYSLASAGAFVLITFPIWTQYGRMLGWLMRLTAHSGRYGSGSIGVIDSTTYLGNIRNLLMSNTLFSAIIAFSLLFLFLVMVLPVLRNKLKNLPEINVLLAVTLVELAGLMLVAKMPGDNYMMPYACLLVLNIFCILLLLWNSSGKTLTSIVLPLLTTIILVLVPYWGLKAKNMLYTPVANQEYIETVKLLSTYDAGYARIYCLPSASPATALFFGNVYARREYLEDLQMMYPNTFFYEAVNHKLMNWSSDTVSLVNVISSFGDKIVLMNMLRGFPLTPGDISYLAKQGIKLNDIYKGQYQTVYEVSTAMDSGSSIQQNPDMDVTCDAETITDDNIFYTTSSGYRFESGVSRSNEKALSGKFSAKLTPSNPYAMTLKMDSLHPGDKFEVSAWRRGGFNDGWLVAAGPSETGFYVQQRMALLNGPDGWNKIVLSFTIPATMAGKQLKIYAWNSGQSELYFDDLRIVMKHEQQVK